MRRTLFILLAGFLFLLSAGSAAAQRAGGLYGGIQYCYPGDRAGRYLGLKGGYRWYPAGEEQLFTLSAEVSGNVSFTSPVRVAVPLMVYADYPLFPNFRLPFSQKVLPIYLGIGGGATYCYQAGTEELSPSHYLYGTLTPRLYFGAVGIEYHVRPNGVNNLVLVGRFNLNRLLRRLIGVRL